MCRMELKLSMDIKALRGPLCVWLPPPPGDRMWFSFLEPPQLQVTASPLVNTTCHPRCLRFPSAVFLHLAFAPVRWFFQANAEPYTSGHWAELVNGSCKAVCSVMHLVLLHLRYIILVLLHACL